VTALTDAESHTKIVEIPKEEVEEIMPSTVSIMAKDLLKILNEN
jgi:hypothetical protein